MSTGSALLADLLKGMPLARPLFLPLAEDVAARVADVKASALSADPALWARASRQAAALVGSDVLTLGFDPALGAAAVSAAIAEGGLPVEDQPAMAALLAAVEHALPASGLGTAVALPGPVALALAVCGEYSRSALERVGPPLVRLMEAVCRHRPHMVVLMEGAESAAVPVDGLLRRAYAPLRKVAAYYDILCAVQPQGYAAAEAAAEITRLSPLGLDVCWLGAGAAGDAGELDGAACLAAGAAFRLVVLPLALDRPAQAAPQAARAWAAASAAGPRLGFTSAGRLPAEADLEGILATRTALGALAA